MTFNHVDDDDDGDNNNNKDNFCKLYQMMMTEKILNLIHYHGCGAYLSKLYFSKIIET